MLANQFGCLPVTLLRRRPLCLLAPPALLASEIRHQVPERRCRHRGVVLAGRLARSLLALPSVMPKMLVEAGEGSCQLSTSSRDCRRRLLHCWVAGGMHSRKLASRV
jgi:hypothetical protein